MSPMGGARLSEGPPKRGELMRDFVLTSGDRRRVGLSDYRGQKNLVVVLAGRNERELLRQLASRTDALRKEQAQVLAVITGAPEEAAQITGGDALPFPVLADVDGAVHVRMGALGTNDQPAPALYITDRFGEVFAAFRTAEGKHLPEVDEVLDWLEFVNSQCEECNPPEWPAVG